MYFVQKTLIFLFLTELFAIPQYYCTGANEPYFPHLLNLIGSIHNTNFNDLETIAVFDFGLKEEQVKQLKRIKKVQVFSMRENNPALTTYYSLPTGKKVFGWFAWKPVVIKEALERFPYILWVDAGTTVLRPLGDLFEVIQETGYFLATIGDNQLSIGWGTTTFVKEQFQLNDPRNQWVLDREFVMGGIIGVAKNGQHHFLDTLYELTRDSRYYADDGTTPNGFGTGRHDQTLLGIISYSRGLQVHEQDPMQIKPMKIGSQGTLFYATWDSQFISDKTHIYSSRGDLRNLGFYLLSIQYSLITE